MNEQMNANEMTMNEMEQVTGGGILDGLFKSADKYLKATRAGSDDYYAGKKNWFKYAFDGGYRSGWDTAKCLDF